MDHLIIPTQHGKPHSFEISDEGPVQVQEYMSAFNIQRIGWIHVSNFGKHFPNIDKINIIT